jgi:hypothetical protein
VNDLDELRSTTFDDGFDDDFDMGFDDGVSQDFGTLDDAAINSGGVAAADGGGFTSTERLIVASLVFVNVLALLFLVYMILFI